jgi:hypothetical protein
MLFEANKFRKESDKEGRRDFNPKIKEYIFISLFDYVLARNYLFLFFA